MKVVALDLSLTAVGVCLSDGSTLTISSRLRGMSRIIELRDDVMFGLDAPMTGEPPALVVIEDYAFSRAASHAHELGELGGAVKLALHEAEQIYLLIGPSSLKKFATGKGNANKIAMAVAAAKVGREFPDDNQCDAWWLRQMALYRYTDLLDPEMQEQVVARTAYRDEAVSKIDWPTLVEPVA